MVQALLKVDVLDMVSIAHAVAGRVVKRTTRLMLQRGTGSSLPPDASRRLLSAAEALSIKQVLAFWEWEVREEWVHASVTSQHRPM